MNAYAVGQITIKDPTKWAEYRQLLPATLAPWNAEVLMRGQNARVLSGHHNHTDIVVLRFPDLQAVHGWHESAAYQALVPLRQKAADVDLISYESDVG